ncbi:nucleobase:cation symporter-1, NCS1 family [Nocardia amikacinitolerans]|uniref:purine-cytosine permease family protein n=1 Tax=Nocardia amikacinitolerans TaxID=756689 RepID=UPI0020A4675E|nr:cytosine permease [Nocardia amikacinitolerans]MCP2297206.1 nucleobase:cation symporter-1, NCS1 family [Nocardia amikacinitolerans]
MKVESHGIEFIPESERYGHPRRLFSIWFSSNMQVTAMVVGALGVVAGLGLGWVILALILGNLVGGIFMAGHSAQGPHLGIPQMIQSRAQFGVFGAGIPLIAVVVAYVLFFAANAVMMRDAVKRVFPVADDTALILFGAVTLVIAYFGYELIHRLGTLMTWASAVFFAAVLVVVVYGGSEGTAVIEAVPATSFSLSIFVLVFTQAMSWSLGFGPFVADYSRYLPSSVSSRATFGYSYGGQVLGASIVMVVGAVVTTAAIDVQASPAISLADLFGPFGSVALIVILLGVLVFNVLCLYSGYMSTVAIFSSMRGSTSIKPGTKLAIMSVIAAVGTSVAISAQDDFYSFFGDILIAQVYVLVPWTAINLMDFYVVRKGNYRISDVFDPDGIYGRFNTPTIAVFVLSILAQVPFMRMNVYQGPVGAFLGVDISCVVGLVVAIVLYLALARIVRFDSEISSEKAPSRQS